MPTSIHENFTARVVQEIWSQLQNAARENEEIAVVVNQIRSEGSSDVCLKDYNSTDKNSFKKTPDASFAHLNSQYPSVVIETSYLQKQKYLAKLAEDYIYGSNGNIGMVLGLDIEYGVESKKASISIWRPQLTSDPENQAGQLMETIEIQKADPFRADDGTTVQGQGLSLQLCDFAPSPSLATVPQKIQGIIVVRITCTQLSSFLLEAETRHEIKRAQKGVQVDLPPNCRKKRREATPPEALSSRKEVKFVKCEAEEEARSEAKDPEWR